MNNRLKLFAFFILCFGFQLGKSYAQVPDSIRTPRDISRDQFDMQDSTNVPKRKDKKSKDPEPPVPDIFKDSTRLAIEALTRKAATRSAILPGWGQLFNGGWGYVKAPLVWVGFGGLGYSFWFAQTNYRETLTEVQYRLANQDNWENPDFQNIPTSFMIESKDFYRRNRDLTILLSVGWYAINIIDAYIDAKFVRYDIDSDLGFNIRPTLLTAPNAMAFRAAPVLGLKATIHIR